MSVTNKLVRIEASQCAAQLTPLGRTLIAPTRALLDWVIDNRAAMAETRLAYAKASKKTA